MLNSLSGFPHCTVPEILVWAWASEPRANAANNGAVGRMLMFFLLRNRDSTSGGCGRRRGDWSISAHSMRARVPRRMTHNTATARWEQTVSGLAAGNVISYWFTYERGGVGNDSPAFS